VQQKSIFTHTNNHKAKYPAEHVVDRKYVVPQDYQENRQGLDRYSCVYDQYPAAKIQANIDCFWRGGANDFFWQLVTAIGKSSTGCTTNPPPYSESPLFIGNRKGSSNSLGNESRQLKFRKCDIGDEA